MVSQIMSLKMFNSNVYNWQHIIIIIIIIIIIENKSYDQLFKRFQFQNNKSVFVTFTARVSQFTSISTIFHKNDSQKMTTLT